MAEEDYTSVIPTRPHTRFPDVHVRDLIDNRLVIPPEARHSSYPVHRIRDGLDASMFDIDDSEITRRATPIGMLHPSVQSWHDYMEAHENDLHADPDGEIGRTQLINNEESILVGTNGDLWINREPSIWEMWNNVEPISKIDGMREELLSATTPKEKESQKKIDNHWDILGL